MRVLVTGAGGQLGIDVVATCLAGGDDVFAATRADLDVTNRDAVLALISTWRPTAVINCAAWTAVDACEGDQDRANLANGLAARWLREGCEHVGAHLVQISTDYVFDGTQPTPYREWDATNPQSVYGSSKLLGEKEAGLHAAIVRTAWVVGEHGSNMVKTILRLAAERPSLSFVDDQRGCPTFTSDLAPMLRRLAIDRRTGIHHVTNQGPMSWFEFARLVVAAAGRDPEMVSPISTADLQPQRPAARPANSVLDNAVLRLQGLRLLPYVEDSLTPLVRRLLGE
jgi:dTDP-4-dehydrorhamnose reductase